MKFQKLILTYSLLATTMVFAQEDSSVQLDHGLVQENLGDPQILVNTDSNLPLEDGFIPYEGDVNVSGGSYQYTTNSSRSYNSQLATSPSCIDLIRQQQGGYIDSQSAISKSAALQTKGKTIGGLSVSAAAGVGMGLATGNPVIGVAVGTAFGLVTGITTNIEKSRINRNGNTVAAAEKLLSGQQLSKKERKAFEKTRKKVSRDAYKNKNALSDVAFAQSVVSNNGLGEKLFCDLDKNGNVILKAQKKHTIKRLSLAVRCEDEKKGIASRNASSIKR